jgi:hypothetical protein
VLGKGCPVHANVIQSNGINISEKKRFACVRDNDVAKQHVANRKLIKPVREQHIGTSVCDINVFDYKIAVSRGRFAAAMTLIVCLESNNQLGKFLRSRLPTTCAVPGPIRAARTKANSKSAVSSASTAGRCKVEG